ncbi:hypothetical protein [Amycolatopsis thermoflava]|uniref:hypothetical protein n=1 Tax=Amycolatopsis thermoflava TaxID=84480 RepID=UPI003F4A13FE
MELTGDPITDALVPIAQRFVGAVREHDIDLMDELLAEVILVTGGRCDPALALAVVCAALVPDGYSPATLLAWLTAHTEFDRLTSRGVSPQIARELADTERTSSS